MVEENSDKPIELDENKATENIARYTSIKLADIIITYRYFGLYEKLSIYAMEELAKRRELGDHFKYEEYIETNLTSLPSLEFKMTDLNTLLSSLGIKGFRVK